MYGLCDCNNFFASCERLFRPELNGRAVVVLSNNDGCVIARSNEAKALGIRMGQPYFQIRELAEQKRVAVFSSNYTLYGDMSRRVIATLRELVPAAEVYSIDEAFLDLHGIAIDQLAEMGRSISRTVLRHTGLPVSVGIAPTKTLAKIASKLCKSYPKLQGGCLMYRPEDIEKVLRNCPVGEVWGVGRKHRRLLEDRGVTTAWDFTQQAPEWVRARMGITGLRMWQELRGEPCIDFESTPQPRQQIMVSRSFAGELHSIDELHKALATFTSSAAAKLREQHSVCSLITVFILTNRHREDLPQYYESLDVRLSIATDDTLELLTHATKALSQIFRNGYGYKKAGVVLKDIAPKTGVQIDLFDPVDRSRQERLMKAIDAVNHNFGTNKLVVASQGIEPLQMNRHHLSKNYTTDLRDIIVVKAK